METVKFESTCAACGYVARSKTKHTIHRRTCHTLMAEKIAAVISLPIGLSVEAGDKESCVTVFPFRGGYVVLNDRFDDSVEYRRVFDDPASAAEEFLAQRDQLKIGPYCSSSSGDTHG